MVCVYEIFMLKILLSPMYFPVRNESVGLQPIILPTIPFKDTVFPLRYLNCLRLDIDSFLTGNRSFVHWYAPCLLKVTNLGRPETPV